MKDQNSTKKAKKAQRKVVKKEVSKSLKDAISKHKKDQHSKKFAKPNAKYDSKNNKNTSNPKFSADNKKSDQIGGKQESSGQKRKFENKKPDGNNKKKSESAVDPKKSDSADGLKEKNVNKSKWADKHEKSASKVKWANKAPSTNGNGSKGNAPNFIDRKAFKPNFKLVEDLKMGWNKVRDRSTTEEARVALLKRMVDQMSTHVLQVTLRHDASRIVQTILQFGNQSQKDVMLGELSVKAYEISKTPYGHFTILKAITYCTRASDQRTIAAAFRGHFVALGTNVIGSRTVESIMQLYPASLTRSLKAEFYGQKFCILLPEAPKSLRALMESLPGKESAIMDHTRDLVQKLVNKSLLEFTYVHNLIWEYTKEAVSSASRMEDLVGQLVESAPKLLSTKPGAKVMCAVISHANAKDRKRILKTLKGHVLESLCHDSAYLGIMRLVDVTDDTVNVQKTLFDELRNVVPEIKYTATGEIIGTPEPPLVAIAKHRTGHKLLLRLLSPGKRHLEPDEEELFSQEVASSKKAPELRRKEHLTFLKAPLVQLCAKYAEELLRSRFGSRVLEEVVLVLHPRSVIDAIARVFAGVESVAVDGDEAEYYDENEDDGEGDEGDYDEEEEEEEGEEGEYDEEEEEGDEDEEDQEGDDDVDLEEDELEVAEDLKQALEGGKKKVSAPVVAETLLSIQEDASAHVLLKKLLQFEAALEKRDGVSSELFVADKKAKKQRVAALAELQAVLVESSSSKQKVAESVGDDAPLSHDESLWQDAYSSADSEENSSLGHLLLGYLRENETLLKEWLHCNRPCFALLKLFQIPSLLKTAVAVLSENSEEVQAGAALHEGGKLLGAIGQAASKL